MTLVKVITPARQQRFHGPARIIALVGGALLVIAPFLPWAYSSAALDDMTVVGYPSPLQILGLVLGLLVVILVGGSMLAGPRGWRRKPAWVRAPRRPPRVRWSTWGSWSSRSPPSSAG